MPKRAKIDPARLAKRQAEQRREDFDRVGLQPAASGLAHNQDISIEQARRADAAAGIRGNVDRARRMDAFDFLRPNMTKTAPGAYDAARKLEKDILIKMGHNDRGRSMERLDQAIESARDWDDKAVEAGRRIKAVLARIGPANARLLIALIDPTPALLLEANTWRDIVFRCTGETHAHAQGAAVRQACINLREAYDAIEKEARVRSKAA